MSIPEIKNNESGRKSLQNMSYFEYVYVFVLIIYAGRANSFVESTSFTENPFGVFLPILLSGLMALKMNLKYDSRFFAVLFGLFVYFVAIAIKYLDIQPTFLISYSILFFIVYTAIKSLRFNFFLIYERIIYYLAIIALLFWIVQTILGGDSLFYIFSRIPGIDTFSYVTGGGLNVLFYSIQPTSYSIIDFIIPRNCGFAWEPGAFSVYLCLAILINLFFIKSDAKRNSRLWILLIALLSTQSTTGYMIFVVIFLFYLLNKNVNIIILLLPFSIVALVYIASLPFMSKKVFELIDETKGVNQLLEDTYGREASATPQRFTSFVLAFKDFQSNPLLGVGGHREATYIYKIGSNISLISGIGNLLAQFGIVGFSFFMIWTLRSSFFFAKHNGYRGKFLLFFVVIFISVSYSIILLPLLMCFWAFGLFTYSDSRDKEIKDPSYNFTADGINHS